MPRIEWQRGASAEANAAAQLPGAAAVFFERAAESISSGSLHELRLRIKRFRYTLELFRDCYGPGIGTRIEVLRRVQQLLGEMTDCATVAGMLSPGESPAFRRFLRVREKRKEAAFHALWRKTLGRPGEQKRWAEYLRRYARPPR